MRLLFCMIFSLCLCSCDSLGRRLSWIKHALDLNSKSGKNPSKQTIDEFFAYQAPDPHPYLTVAFQRKLDLATHSRLTAGNQVSLLPNAQSVQLKLDLIRKAKKKIWVSTFQIICDQGGEQFSKALIEAVARGVEVRFLITGGPWTWAFSGNCPNRMRQTKVQVATMPYSYITNNGVVQLHDKIFIVDSNLAVVGGQNIGSLYSKNKTENGRFRDTDAIITGPVVMDILGRFSTLWNLAKPADTSMSAPVLEASPQNYASWLGQKPIKGLCRFVSQTPHQQDFFVFEAYKLYALETQQRIIFHSLTLNTLGSPEQELLWEAFTRVNQKPAAKVFLLTNGPGFLNSDMMPAWAGRITGHYYLSTVYDSLIGSQIEAFAYPSFLHSKVYFFDNFAVGIGSFNFDETGLIWTESSLICLDRDFAEQAAQMFKSDLEISYRLPKI